jgi:hypothetical protein
MLSLGETACFIRAHYPASQAWGGDLEKWVTWASNKRFLFQICGEDGLTGVAIARPVAGVQGLIDNNDWHDINGNYIFIDLAIASTKPVQQAIAFGILARFGQREFVAFRRNGKLKIHRSDKVRKALLR